MRWLQKVLAWWRGDVVSATWLRQQRQSCREEFHSVRWPWPLVKK